MDLAFVSAIIDQEKSLLDACLGIVQRLIDSDDNDRALRNLFSRLLYYIEKWSDSVQHSDRLRNFYHTMLDSAPRRSIMGAILTYVCIPEKPQNLDFLRVLLNSISAEEYFIKYTLTRRIAYNYIEELPGFFSATIKWNANVDQNNPSAAFSHFYFSLLFEFYEQRFSWIKDGGLGYQIIKKSAEDISGDLFRQLFSFVFIKNGEIIFDKVYGPQISKQIQNARLLTKAQKEAFYSMYGFILVNWYYLLTLIKGEDNSRVIDIERIMKDTLVFSKEWYLLESLLSALHKVVKKYNVLIISESDPRGKKMNKKIAYKTKRDAARTLIQIIEEIK